MLEIVFIVRKVLNPGFFLHKRKSPESVEHFLLAFLGFSRLSRKLVTFSGTLRSLRVFSWLFQAFQETLQSRRSQECNVVNLLLAFPGFSRLSRKPCNQGGAKSAMW